MAIVDVLATAVIATGVEGYLSRLKSIEGELANVRKAMVAANTAAPIGSAGMLGWLNAVGMQLGFADDAIKALGIAALVGGIYLAGKTALAAAEDFDDFNKSLKVTFGSQGAGDQAFRWARQFAREGKGELNEVVDGLKTLRRLGIAPTEQMMESLADVSIITNKTIRETAVATAFAIHGQWWRLQRSFGIRKADIMHAMPEAFNEKGNAKTPELALEAMQKFYKKRYGGAAAEFSTELFGELRKIRSVWYETWGLVGQAPRTAVTKVLSMLRQIIQMAQPVAVVLLMGIGKGLEFIMALFEKLWPAMRVVIYGFMLWGSTKVAGLVLGFLGSLLAKGPAAAVAIASLAVKVWHLAHAFLMMTKAQMISTFITWLSSIVTWGPKAVMAIKSLVTWLYVLTKTIRNVGLAQLFMSACSAIAAAVVTGSWGPIVAMILLLTALVAGLVFGLKWLARKFDDIVGTARQKLPKGFNDFATAVNNTETSIVKLVRRMGEYHEKAAEMVADTADIAQKLGISGGQNRTRFAALEIAQLMKAYRDYKAIVELGREKLWGHGDESGKTQETITKYLEKMYEIRKKIVHLALAEHDIDRKRREVLGGGSLAQAGIKQWEVWKRLGNQITHATNSPQFHVKVSVEGEDGLGGFVKQVSTQIINQMMTWMMQEGRRTFGTLWG
jgi:hypothetical protein